MLTHLPSRTTYGSDNAAGIESYKRPGRGISIPLSQTGRLDSQYDSSDGSFSRTSPPADSDSKNGGPARRRIAVACERCRKRKIKCSGDQGDNRGCNNCRNSGVQRCQFLRVQSTIMETRNHIPYQAGGRQSLIPSTIPRSSAYSVGPYQTGVNQYGQITPSFDNYSQTSSQTMGRSPYSFTSEEETQAFYNIQAANSPAFMLPNSIPYYSPTVSQKSWNYPTATRTPQSSVYSEAHATTTLSPSNTSYISSSSASDVSGAFPSVSSVISSSTPTLDRTLPDPASARGFNGTFSSAAESNADHMGLGSATYRPSGGWNSVDSFSTENRYRDITRANSTSDPQDLGFGYSMAAPSGSSRMVPSSDHGNTIASPNSYRANLSGSGELSPDASASDNYGYSTETSPRRESVGSLSNGDTYTRFQSSERLTSPYGIVHRPEEQGYAGNRTSLTNMSTEGRY